MRSCPPPVSGRAIYRAWKGLIPEAEQPVFQDYVDDGSDRGPRCYPVSAVNAAIEAIVKGRTTRALLATRDRL